LEDAHTPEHRMPTLADRLARGDDSAFAELYDACADRLHRYAAARLGSRDAASDVVQSTFLRAVKGRRHFKKVESPAAYLFQIVRNETIRAAAKQKRDQRITNHPVHVSDTGHGVSPSPDATTSFEDAEALANAVTQLDPVDQEIIALKLEANITFAEIAAVLDCPQGTVATRYRRALETLRTRLAKEFSPDH
jgi:RNA polymerase sigma-70 factor (ECF subfamily)